MSKPARNAAILAEFNAGTKMVDIAREHGITRARVQQILARMGYTPKDRNPLHDPRAMSIIADYKSGMPAKAVVQKYKIYYGKLKHLLRITGTPCNVVSPYEGIVELYNAGVTTVELAHRYKRTRNDINMALKRHGINPSTKHAWFDGIDKDYTDGMSIEALEEKYSATRQQIYHALRYRGVDVPYSRYPKRKRK